MILLLQFVFEGGGSRDAVVPLLISALVCTCYNCQTAGPFLLMLSQELEVGTTRSLFIALLPSPFPQLTNTVKPYVIALMQGMPQKCKLPLYEYGSKGVLGFYQAQLLAVTTYRDLQTDVFQAFKEIGNTVLFCLQLEKALVGVGRSCHVIYM